MKRLFSPLIAIILLFTTVLFPASAAENNEYEQLLSSACEIFPEYAASIRGDVASTRALSNYCDNTVVFSETRMVAENDYLTCTEYANGSIVLTEVSSGDDCCFDYDLTTNSYSSSSGGTTRNITIKAAYVGLYYSSGTYFKLSNIIYTTASGAYGTINSAGTGTTSGDCSILEGSPFVIYNETASTAAKIVYNLSFHIGSNSTDFTTSTLTFSLKNNSVTISHVGACPFC